MGLRNEACRAWSAALAVRRRDVRLIRGDYRELFMRPITLGSFSIIALAIFLSGCKSNENGPHAFHYANVEQKFAPGERPTKPPEIIYVGDFDLGSTTLKTDPGLAAQISASRPRLFGNHEPSDPAE